MFNAKRFALPLTVALLLSACTTAVGPQASGIDAPSLWSRLVSSTPDKPDLDAPLVTSDSAQVEHNWWKHFADPTLDALIGEALANNKSLQIAKARVEEAKAGRTSALSRLMPSIDITGSATRANQGYASNNKPVSVAEADIGATWELDLFGRNQARSAEADAILQSTEAGQQAVRVGLLAEVARNYFDMRNYERQIAITKQNLVTEQKTLELIQAQMKGALASDFDVQRAAAQVSTTEAIIPALATAYDASMNRLNVLLGYAPGTKDAMFKTTQDLKPLDHHILIVAPAKVLAARPDVKVTERQFAASISAKEAAKAAMFPDISLTALFGLQTATPFNSTPWGLGASVLQPVVNFGRIEAQIDAADAQQKQAFLNYQQTVLEALENMENALSSYVHETTRNASLTNAVARNRKAAELAKQQYNSGYAGLLDVLVSERNLLDAEASQAASDASLRKNLVNIYAASGGGWDDTDATKDK